VTVALRLSTAGIGVEVSVAVGAEVKVGRGAKEGVAVSGAVVAVIGARVACEVGATAAVGRVVAEARLQEIDKRISTAKSLSIRIIRIVLAH
jgi:hypothetical protein